MKIFAFVLILLLSGCASPAGPVEVPSSVPAEIVSTPSTTALELYLSSFPAMTYSAVVVIEGNVSEPALITIQQESMESRYSNSLQADAQWEFTIQLEPGENNISVTADTGAAQATEAMQIVRMVNATIVLQFNGYPDREDRTETVTYNPSEFASAPRYENVNTTHPDYPTIHDLLVTWERKASTDIEFSHSSSFGFGVSRIDGAGNPLDSGAPPWWCYSVNGEAAPFGISMMPVVAEDVVLWDLGTCGMIL